MALSPPSGVPTRYLVDPRLNEYRPLTAAGTPLANRDRIDRVRSQFIRGRLPYNSKTQPRDQRGQFRKVLARLRFDLGKKQLQNIVAEIRKAEAADEIGDYKKSTDAAINVVGMVDKIGSGALDAHSLKNIRAGARDLGKVLAYLPLPQGDDTAKVRFSDLPPSTKQLVNDMITRVVKKVGSDKAVKVNAILESFMSGGRTMTADELLGELNRLLRVLT